jgi:hypothetical protein
MAAEDVLKELSEKYSENEELMVMVAALTASWAEMAARLSIAEGKLAVVSGVAAASLQRTGDIMKQLEQEARASDAALADLHSQIADELSEAAQLTSKADRAMESVLKTYRDFQGNVTQLKKNVASLANSAIAAVAPGAQGLLAGRLEKILGIEESA